MACPCKTPRCRDCSLRASCPPLTSISTSKETTRKVGRKWTSSCRRPCRTHHKCADSLMKWSYKASMLRVKSSSIQNLRLDQSTIPITWVAASLVRTLYSVVMIWQELLQEIKQLSRKTFGATVSLTYKTKKWAMLITPSKVRSRAFRRRSRWRRRGRGSLRISSPQRLWPMTDQTPLSANSIRVNAITSNSFTTKTEMK